VAGRVGSAPRPHLDKGRRPNRTAALRPVGGKPNRQRDAPDGLRRAQAPSIASAPHGDMAMFLPARTNVSSAGRRVKGRPNAGRETMGMAEGADRFRVLAPPPLLYAGSLGLGFILNRVRPAPLSPLAAWTPPVAGILAALGVGLAGWAAWLFRRAGTHLEPGRPATTLVTAGPYRLSRNPIYLGLTLAYGATALALRNGWALGLLAVVLPLIRYGVIAREEEYLERRFGPTYLRYKSRVRRWI
jgi:protein-S-isoprenylcysteine O-methyltransferase Ste14